MNSLLLSAIVIVTQKMMMIMNWWWYSYVYHQLPLNLFLGYNFFSQPGWSRLKTWLSHEEKKKLYSSSTIWRLGSYVRLAGLLVQFCKRKKLNWRECWFCDFQILADACKNMNENAETYDSFFLPVHTYVMNPKSITMGELYGDYNKLTMEWNDGLMGITVRYCVQVNISRFDLPNHRQIFSMLS